MDADRGGDGSSKGQGCLSEEDVAWFETWYKPSGFPRTCCLY